MCFAKKWPFWTYSFKPLAGQMYSQEAKTQKRRVTLFPSFSWDEMFSKKLLSLMFPPLTTKTINTSPKKERERDSSWQLSSRDLFLFLKEVFSLKMNPAAMIVFLRIWLPISTFVSTECGLSLVEFSNCNLDIYLGIESSGQQMESLSYTNVTITHFFLSVAT